jgi:hypothetical protein
MGMGMFPPNMMGMNPNNINLNSDPFNNQGMTEMNNMQQMQQYLQNMQGFNSMFQGQFIPQNQNKEEE